MGASYSSVVAGASPSEPIDDGEYPIDQHAVLNQYKLEHRLFPGSGRMMKTYQLRHRSNQATAVMKAMWVDTVSPTPTPQQLATQSASTSTNSTPLTMLQVLQEQQEELKRIKQALQEEPHVAPFTYWAHQTEFFANNASNLLRQRQPVYLLRPHLYTTLSDRLASRPFFTAIEKVWMTHQLLQALAAMHSHRVCHGFVTTENVGLTSWNWLVLTDISSYKAHTALPDDDPSEYLFYFQDHHHHDASTNATTTTADEFDTSALGGTSTSKKMSSGRNREKRCYLAPERFVGTSSSADTKTETMMLLSGDNTTSYNPMTTPCSKTNQLTPAMDIYSAGCVMMELWLNGDRALDLGDLMEYRRGASTKAGGKTTLPPQLQQKLNKIEQAALRAACKHMVQLDPSQRLSARAYLDRLQASEAVPLVMEECLEPLLRRVSDPSQLHILTPDARLAWAAAHYEKVLWETLGVKDPEGAAYLRRVLGSAAITMESDNDEGNGREIDSAVTAAAINVYSSSETSVKDLFAETEALLQKLDSLALTDDDEEKTDKETLTSTTAMAPTNADEGESTPASTKRPDICKSSLLIYLQLILASIRHVRHPTTKVVALQMLKRICDLCNSDEIRLQRMVPVAIALLQDQDALVRASALTFLAHVVSKVQVFSPSDSKIFPQYIFKRVSPLLTDPSLMVRLAFSKSICVLAETAQRFLDISHAVRLYEAIGGGGSSVALGHSASNGSLSADETSSSTGHTSTKQTMSTSPNVFGDDVAKLLGDDLAKKDEPKSVDDTVPNQLHGTFHGGGNLASSPSGKTLINSNYQEELAALQETVSRWVVHITTDPSEHSSPTKRALLDSNLSRLCTFFGLEGVMAFILPQILAFLNDRKDTQLRTALFSHLPSVCRFVGRAATEQFVLPCLDSGLVDQEEEVVGAAIRCLAELIAMGLISRSALLGNVIVSNTTGSDVELSSDGYVTDSIWGGFLFLIALILFILLVCNSLL